jgi:hypothetical protein
MTTTRDDLMLVLTRLITQAAGVIALMNKIGADECAPVSRFIYEHALKHLDELDSGVTLTMLYVLDRKGGPMVEEQMYAEAQEILDAPLHASDVNAMVLHALRNGS